MKQTLKYIYACLIDIMKIAEGKYAITLTLASGVIVLGTSFIGSENILAKVCAGASIIFSLVSMIYGFCALLARTIKIRKKKLPKKIDNLTFYKTIIKFDEQNYLEQIIKEYNFPKSYKPDAFEIDLAKNIIAQANVVYFKFLFFNLSLIFLLFSVFFAVVMIIIVGGF